MAGEGYQKLHTVEKSIATGDVKGADQVLTTINDRMDQAIFKSLIANHCHSKANDLPACSLDEDGLHFAGDKKMTLTDRNGQLRMRNDAPSWTDRAMDLIDVIESAPGLAYQVAKDFFGETSLGDSLNRSATPDSDLNRLWNAEIKTAEGDG